MENVGSLNIYITSSETSNDAYPAHTYFVSIDSFGKHFPTKHTEMIWQIILMALTFTNLLLFNRGCEAIIKKINKD